jgi:diguanylate cyclase (GGDEF)-like protein
MCHYFNRTFFKDGASSPREPDRGLDGRPAPQGRLTLDPTQVVLGQWSLGVQLGIVAMLALFFLALSRSVKLREVRLWAAAWTANAVALTFVFLTAFWFESAAMARVSAFFYAAGKTLFAILFVMGTRDHLLRGMEVRFNVRRLILLVVMWSVVIGFFAGELALVQLGQAAMVGSIFLYGAFSVLMHPRAARSRWLGWAMLAEGLLFLHYVPLLIPVVWFAAPLANYLRYPSFFDAGAELFLALGALVALESSVTDHLTHLNDELVASQDRLRQLVDLDPLTNLSNRRGFREEVNRRRNQDSTLIFLDVDNFKEINDRFGHQVGDECLRRLARELARVFRTEDALFRWGGDEFLVVSRDLDPGAAHERVEALRAVMRAEKDGAPHCFISAGVSLLPPGRDPEAALKEADERMYADKIIQKSHRRG